MKEYIAEFPQKAIIKTKPFNLFSCTNGFSTKNENNTAILVEMDRGDILKSVFDFTIEAIYEKEIKDDNRITWTRH